MRIWPFQVPRGSLPDGGHHAGAALLDDVRAQLVEIVDAVLGHHVGAGASRRCRCSRPAHGCRPRPATGSRTLARTMRITLSSILPSRIRGSSGRNRPSWIDLPPVGRLAEAADVDHVRGAGEQRHQLAVVEGGRGDDDVVEMAGALPRIVGDVGIARLHRLDRELADEVDDAARHRVHVARRAGDGLGQHPAFEVEHAGRDVAGLARAGREGGAHQGAGLLLDDGEQAVPHHLQANIAEEWRVLMRGPPGRSGPAALMRAVKPLRHDGGGAVLDDQRRPVERHAGLQRRCARGSRPARARPLAGSSTSRWPRRCRGGRCFATALAGEGSGRSVASDRVQVSASTSSLGMARPNTCLVGRLEAAAQFAARRWRRTARWATARRSRGPGRDSA